VRRDKHTDVDETPGGDSFLDIVANIVGILVLLVVVVGVRAGRDVFVPPPADAEPGESLAEIESRLDETLRQTQIDKREAFELRDKLHAAQAEADRREQEREAATLYLTKLRSELDEASASLEADDRRGLETANAIAQAQLKLDRLAREQVALASVEPEPELETVTVAPTPIVDGRADQTISFRLKDGRLVYVPVNELENQLQSEIRAPSISDPSKAAVTRQKLGPVEGFEAEAEIAWAVRVAGNRIGLMPKLGKLVLREVTELRGEDPPTAFRPGGYVASRLDLLQPEDYVVRLIVYADSFETAPEVSDRFRERGFRVAQSLKNDGSPIGFSSDGYKAVTQ